MMGYTKDMVTEDEQMSAALDEHPDLVERFKAGDVTALVELMEAVLGTEVGAVVNSNRADPGRFLTRDRTKSPRV